MFAMYIYAQQTEPKFIQIHAPAVKVEHPALLSQEWWPPISMTPWSNIPRNEWPPVIPAQEFKEVHAKEVQTGKKVHKGKRNQ